MTATKSAGLFVLTMILGGLGGALGSMAGHALGSPGLYAGGVIGGLIGVAVAARLAVAFKWIARESFARTAIGAAIGFLVAALIAVNTLSSPVGPVASSLLIGIGAVIGARRQR
jgi:hypothetical protein